MKSTYSAWRYGSSQSAESRLVSPYFPQVNLQEKSALDKWGLNGNKKFPKWAFK